MKGGLCYGLCVRNPLEFTWRNSTPSSKCRDMEVLDSSPLLPCDSIARECLGAGRASAAAQSASSLSWTLQPQDCETNVLWSVELSYSSQGGVRHSPLCPKSCSKPLCSPLFDENEGDFLLTKSKRQKIIFCFLSNPAFQFGAIFCGGCKIVTGVRKEREEVSVVWVPNECHALSTNYI